jgi:hypothetical protein
MPTNDNTNITGLSQLLQGFDDATTVEKEIVNNKREESELGEYRRQMNEIGDSLGIDGELGELLELDPPKEAEQEDDLFGDEVTGAEMAGEETVAEIPMVTAVITRADRGTTGHLLVVAVAPLMT